MTKEERTREIEKLSEWISEMEWMLTEDGTVPVNMRLTYERQLENGRERLVELEGQG
jgi:hypothetical protein